MTSNEQIPKHLIPGFMYGPEDNGDNPVFPGGYINFGYWEGLVPEGQPTLEDRIQSARNMYRLVFDRLGEITPEDDVLEVGCGMGQGLRQLCEEVRPRLAVGVDASIDQTRRARVTLEDVPGKVRVQRSHAEALPFGYDMFDKAYSVEAIQHFDGPKEFVGELGRVVRAGGNIAVASFFTDKEDASPKLKKLFPTFEAGIDHAVNVAEMQSWLTEYGFTEPTIEPIGEHVWERFVEWRNMVMAPNVSTAWLDAYKGGLLDYYVISATKNG